MSPSPEPDTVYLRWIWCRAVLHRGWWLVTSVYLVVDAHLSASELVLIGVAQALVTLTFEIPAGVVADTISRKRSLVASHALMGTAMLATGLVTGFGPLMATQMLWGLSWTLASGADVAWITDELDAPARISVVLVRAGQAQLTGAAAGVLGVGALAWLTHRRTAMVLAGTAMLLLGVYVAGRFGEQRFVPAASRRWSAAWSILVRGLALVRTSRAILVMFAATFLVNGVTSAFGRVYLLHLVDLGLPVDPVAWVTALGVLALLVGTLALRVVQPRINDVRAAQGGYVIACGVAALGTVALAGATEPLGGSAAVLLAISALPLTRTLGSIWVNRQTGSGVRATVHSFLAQASALGEVGCGLTVAAVARLAGLPLALVACSALLAIAILLIQRPGIPRTTGAA